MTHIRIATEDDLPTLRMFQLQLALESENIRLDENALTAGLRSLLKDPNKGVYYVAVDNDEIVGCHLITYEWSDWRNGTVWWLQSVYVIQSHRTKGIFRLMYENIINMIKQDSSLIGLRLYVDKSNARAMKVYEAMGMNGQHYTVYEWIK